MPRSKPAPMNASDAAKASFLPTMRELARAYQAFANYSDRHVRTLDLTPPQFDVIATLGGTEGMNMKDLAAHTLVTKGTLTGIVDRLETRGLVRREIPPENRRSFTVLLTEAGDELFQQVFPAHVEHLQGRFERLEPQELELLRGLLKKLREQF